MNNQDMEKIALKYKGKKLSPLKAIRNYCKEMCCASQIKSWKDCSFTACFLYRYRFGKMNMPKNKESKKKHKGLRINSSKNNALEEDVKKDSKQNGEPQ